MAIETPLGHVVYGTNTRLLGVRPEPFAGRRRFTFTLEDVRLGLGHYQLRVSLLATTAHERYDAHGVALEFDAIAEYNAVGDIWTTTRLAQTPLP